jgi:hypothetical protein
MSSKSKEPLSAAERMRHYRKRRRNGLRSVRVLLHATEIDSLIHQGLLKQERRDDGDAIENAIGGFICHVLTPRDEKES